MRTIGFRSNVLFILAAAFGLVAALGRPWYAAAPAQTAEEVRIGDVNGPVEDFFLRLTREFTTATGKTGWDAFTSTDTILCALIGVVALAAVFTLIPAIQQPAREVLRLTAFALLGIVVVKLVNTPDALVERRQGAWLALVLTGIMATSANTIYNAPLVRPRSGRPLYETPPARAVPERSHVFDTPGSVTPDPLDPTQPAA